MKLLPIASLSLPYLAANTITISKDNSKPDTSVKELLESINSNNQAAWTAGLNFLQDDEFPSQYSYLLGAYLGPHPEGYDLPTKDNSHFLLKSEDLPKNFDPVTKWPECEHSLTMIRDQGSCGSCWAFGAAEAMSDRVCIASNGDFHGDISSEDILACCGFTCGNGCNGGWPLMAWRYFKNHGVVTGGLYGDKKSGCAPYVIEPCEHHTTGPRPSCTGEEGHTPKCPYKCIPEYPKSWKEDKHYAVSAYKIANDELAIMKELYENGPVETAFTVYEDFMLYKGGVYHHVSGKALGGHAIRLVGWGEEEESGEKYWVLANSWNTDWGENGYFRVRRGVNECGIEEEVVAGIAEPSSFRRLFDGDSERDLL